MVWSLMLQQEEAQWQCCQKGEWVTATPPPPPPPINPKIRALIPHAQNKIQFKRPATAKHVCSRTHTHTPHAQVHTHTLKLTVGLTRFCRFAGGAPGFSGLGCSDTNSLTARGRTRLTDIKLKLDGQLLQCTALTLMLHPLL